MNKEILIDASHRGGFGVYVDGKLLEGVKSVDGADCTGDVVEVKLTIIADNLTAKLPTGKCFDLGKSLKEDHKRRKIPNGKGLIDEVWKEFEDSVK